MADPYHSGVGIGAVDGVNPNLVDATGLGPVEAPTTTGTNPYGSAGAFDHGAALSMGADAQLAEPAMEHSDLSLVPEQAASAEAHGDASFGVPIDDGLT